MLQFKIKTNLRFTNIFYCENLRIFSFYISSTQVYLISSYQLWRARPLALQHLCSGHGERCTTCTASTIRPCSGLLTRISWQLYRTVRVPCPRKDPWLSALIAEGLLVRPWSGKRDTVRVGS